MPLHLGQLIYTSFAVAGLKTLASPTVPAAIQQVFLQAVVHQYWNAYRPPQSDFQAIYLYQAASNQTLFGWVYDDGLDDLGRSHVPYFLCYYLEEPLQTALLERICDCLEQGPLLLYDRQRPPTALNTIPLPEGQYTSVQPGIKISPGLWIRSQETLRQGRLLNWFISADGQEIEAGAPPSGGRDLPSPIPEAPPLAPMTAKVALLIGVSNCAAGFRALPGVEKDVAAMQQVLAHPEVGGFIAVQTLINPNPQTMAEAIEHLCGDRRADDLILLYFSGHALQDDKGNIYWSTGISRRDPQGKLVRSSMIAASFVQDVMNQCASKQQVVILDSCWNDGVTRSTAAHPFLNLKQQLGGPERVLITASASACSPLSNKGADLSAYTFYLVEGLKTGAADFNGDGIISLLEWHEYARCKVQAATPALSPQLYGHLEDQAFQIARAPLEEPKLQYRKGVEACIRQSGKITLVNRTVLDALQDSLGLKPEEAASIEAAVLKPHQIYQKKLQVYAQHFVETIQRAFSLSPETEDRLQQLRSQLGLTAENTGPLEAQLSRQLKVVQAPQPALALPTQQSAPQEPRQNFWVQAMAVAQGVVPVLMHRGQALVRTLYDPQSLKAATHPWWQLRPSRQTWLRAGAVLLPLLLFVGLISALRQRQSQQDARQLQAITALTEQRNYESCLSQWQQVSRRAQAQAQRLRQTCEAGLNWQNSRSRILRGHQGAVWTVALSPEGQTIASAGDDREIKLWSLNTGKLLRSLSGHTDTVWSVAISPDGRLLASASADQTVQLWDLSTGKPLRTFSDHGATVWTVAFSADGNLLASGSDDYRIKLWNVKTGSLVRTLAHQGPVRSLAFSPDGQWLASGSGDQTIGLWHLETGKLERSLAGHQERVIAVAISPDGQLLASGSGDQTLKLWDLKTGKLQHTLSGYREAVTGVTMALTGSGLSSKSQPLVAGSSGNTLKLWNGATAAAIHTLPAPTGKITAVAFSPDGLNLIAANQDQTLTIWQR